MPRTAPRRAASDPLATYRCKRDFARTREPAGATSRSSHCRRGAGSSCSGTGPAGCTTTSGWRSTGCWSAGPCRRARRSTRRCAARRSTSRTTRWSTIDFEGVIPAGEYGGGDVIVWDAGTWDPAARGARPGRRGAPTASCTSSCTARSCAAGSCSSGRRRTTRARTSWLLLHKKDEYAVAGLGRGGASALGAVRPHQRRGEGRPGPAVALGPAGRAGRGRPAARRRSTR